MNICHVLNSAARVGTGTSPPAAGCTAKRQRSARMPVAGGLVSERASWQVAVQVSADLKAVELVPELDR